MATTKKALAAAAFLGFAGALLSPPALAIVSPGSDPGRSMQALHPGIYLAMEAEKKKATKTKAEAPKTKKTTAKGKAKGTGSGSGTGTPSSGGSGDYQ